LCFFTSLASSSSNTSPRTSPASPFPHPLPHPRALRTSSSSSSPTTCPASSSSSSPHLFFLLPDHLHDHLREHLRRILLSQHLLFLLHDHRRRHRRPPRPTPHLHAPYIYLPFTTVWWMVVCEPVLLVSRRFSGGRRGGAFRCSGYGDAFFCAARGMAIRGRVRRPPEKKTRPRIEEYAAHRE
jgi:hypothetical protein